MNEMDPFEINQDMRERAFYLRYSAIESLETHLLALETSLIDHNINVVWAQDEQTLCNSIVEALPNSQYNNVCLDLHQVPDGLSSFGNVINTCPIESVANHDREIETLIIDSDFAIAENGSLVFIDRKAKDCFNLFKNIIVIVNIDQILASQSDLSLFLRLKSNEKKGYFPKDVKIIGKPFDKVISDIFMASNSVGYTKEQVKITALLYENNIYKILQNVNLRQSLYCIHCGKCAEVCPVMQSTNGNGISPIELVKRNCFDEYNRTHSIFQQTTLCGNCQEVCPVNIPIVDLLISEMDMVSRNTNYGKTKSFFSVLSKRSKINKKNSPFFRFFFLRNYFGKNKMLLNYLMNQKSQFYNISRNQPDLSNSNKIEEENVE